jgi:predicted N-acetyltransferase YhbS
MARRTTVMGKKQWSMRPYREGDEASICQLFALTMGKELTAARWNWLYRDNHTGVVLITVAEGEHGELAGQCALKPVRMKVGSKVCLGAQSLDAAVRPDYQGQGIYTELAAYACRTAAEKGVPLVYGFPNRNSHHLLASRLNRVDLWDRPPVFMLILDAEQILGMRIHNEAVRSVVTPLGRMALSWFYSLREIRIPHDCRLVPVDRFDDRMDEFWERASRPYQIAVVRDRQYLNWRYVENPEKEYSLFVIERHGKVAGYIVLKCERRFEQEIGFIVDMLTLPGEQELADGLIAEAVRFFQAQHMHVVSCLMLEHLPYTRSLAANRFVKMPRRLLPQELYLSVRGQSDEHPEDLIVDPRNWFITWGDHDVV